MLYRIGANAYLTLGNKKSVDIIIENNGQLITIDVKGLKDKSGFSIDNWLKKDENHYLVFVSFLNNIEDTKQLPEVHIVPSMEIDIPYKELNNNTLVYKNPKGNRRLVQSGCLRKVGIFSDKWDYFK